MSRFHGFYRVFFLRRVSFFTGRLIYQILAEIIKLIQILGAVLSLGRLIRADMGCTYIYVYMCIYLCMHAHVADYFGAVYVKYRNRE